MYIFYRDGLDAIDGNSGNMPNYYPNSFSRVVTKPKYLEHADNYTGDVKRYDSSKDQNYEQVTEFWTKVLKKGGRARLVANIAGHLGNAAPFIQERGIKNFSKVHPEFGSRLREALKQHSQM